MRFFKTAIFSALFCTGLFAQVDTTASHYWMMTYFLNAQEGMGARFAFSSDSTGINWQLYNNGNVFISPTVTGADGTRLMRDPMVSFDSVNNKFNFVWTVSWVGNTIGWSTSTNLKDWSQQIAVPVGSTITGSYCCWAPEIFWDDTKGQWMIIWSTSTSAGGDKNIFFTNVPANDFTRIAPSKLLFNPGFTIIDADMMKYSDNKYYMVFKDERTSFGTTMAKNVHYVTASQPTGPWLGPNLLGNHSDAVMSQGLSTSGTEGPCLLKQGGEFHLFFDPYSAQATYRYVKPTNNNLSDTTSPWKNAGTMKANGTAFNYSHCNIIEVPRRYVMYMLYGTSLPQAPAAPTLTSPANGQTDVSLTQLAWSAVSGATGYNVQVSTSSDFAAIAALSGTASNSAVVGLHANTTYYWRVNASTAAAGAGAWSNVWSFATLHSATLPETRLNVNAADLHVANNTLSYGVKKAGLVEISFKDMLGRTTTILSRQQAAGHYTVGLKNYKLAAGKYVVDFKCAGVEKTATVMITK